jgi:PEP-CTERM motif
MFSAIRNAALGLTVALCALTAYPRAADATVVYTLSGDDPSIGGLLSVIFSSSTFITPAPLTPFPNLTTCIVEGTACNPATSGFALDGLDPTQTNFFVHIAGGDSIVSTFLTSSVEAFGTYTSLDRGGLVTLTVAAEAVPEPASLALFGVGLAGLGMVLRTRRA